MNETTTAPDEPMKCGYEGSGYPHPGCAEFGPPDTWSCDNDAVTLLIWDEPQWGTSWILMCAEHDRDARDDIEKDEMPVDCFSIEEYGGRDGVRQLLVERVTVTSPDEGYEFLGILRDSWVGVHDPNHCYSCYLARPETDGEDEEAAPLDRLFSAIERDEMPIIEHFDNALYEGTN